MGGAYSRPNPHLMTKRKIKIVKRDAPVPKPEVQPVLPKDPERGMTNAVKGWISERRQNRQRETTSNDRQVLNWQKLPDTSRKPA
jgi:hypothetical protein